MASTARAVFVVAAKRTPFGTFGGKLRSLTATDLGKVAAAGALQAGQIPPEAVDSVIIGNVIQVGGAWVGAVVCTVMYHTVHSDCRYEP